MNDQDSKRVWEAIDWKGRFQDVSEPQPKPSDQEFKDFYESFMNDIHNDSLRLEADSVVTIPVIDDPITTEEVIVQINSLNSNKACGPDGVPPGALKLLPAQFILQITTLFNIIFGYAQYPSLWSRTKFFSIFKSGNRAEAKNYRGINVMNGIAKVYGMVLGSRIQQWFSPCREQAGA